MTRQYFPLGREERIQERVMLSFLAVFFITVITGVYTQSHNINFDPIFVPLLMFSGGAYYLLKGINGFREGNLIIKYGLFSLPLLVQYLLKRWTSQPTQKARKITAISFGSLSLLIAGILFSLGVLVVVKGV